MLYKIFRFLFYCILKIVSRLTIYGVENIPSSGPVILVSNHISNWDPMIVGISANRQVHFIAKEELFKFPPLRYLMLAWGALPVKRGRGDREVISKSLEVLKDQKILGIFIEGTRNKVDPNRMQKPQPGAAMLTLKSGAVVVPMLVTNSNRISRLSKVEVFIGKPITFTTDPGQDKKELYSEISQTIVNAIESLRGAKKGA